MQHWDASAQVYLQPNDYLLLDAGAVAYEGRTNFSGSLLSLGFDSAQLDIGLRPHWFSPLTDSSMLMSTEAPTMPSVTLSNYRPLTRLGLHYELFIARMSNSNRIVFGNGLTAGHPRLGGFPSGCRAGERLVTRREPAAAVWRRRAAAAIRSATCSTLSSIRPQHRPRP